MKKDGRIIYIPKVSTFNYSMQPCIPSFQKNYKVFKNLFKSAIFILLKNSVLEYSTSCISGIYKLKGWLLNVVTSLLVDKKLMEC